MENTNQKIRLLNDLIEIVTEKEMVWKFHPDNPEGIDIKKYYSKLQREETNIERIIKNKTNR